MDITFNTYNEFLTVSNQLNKEINDFRINEIISNTMNLYNEMTHFISNNIVELDYINEEAALISDKTQRRASIFEKIRKFIEDIVNRIKNAIETLINKKTDEVLEKQNKQLTEMKEYIQQNQKDINTQLKLLNHSNNKMIEKINILYGKSITNSEQLATVVEYISMINSKLDGIYVRQEALAAGMEKVNKNFAKLKQNVTETVTDYFDKSLASYNLTKIQIDKINKAINENLEKYSNNFKLTKENIIKCLDKKDDNIIKAIQGNEEKIKMLNDKIEKINFDKLNETQGNILKKIEETNTNITSLNFAAKQDREKKHKEIKQTIFQLGHSNNENTKKILQKIHTDTNDICKDIKSFNDNIMQVNNVFWKGLQFIDNKMPKDNSNEIQEILSLVKKVNIDNPYSELPALRKVAIRGDKEDQIANTFNGGSSVNSPNIVAITNFNKKRLGGFAEEIEKNKSVKALIDVNGVLNIDISGQN